MADGTIMDKETHGKSKGTILLPANVVVQKQINTLINEALGNLGATPNQSLDTFNITTLRYGAK